MNPNRYRVGSWVFLRLLAIVHLIAFVSAWRQIGAIAGPNGIMPASRLFTEVHAQLGSSAYWELPSLCWIFGTGWFLKGMCAIGVALSVLLFAGVAPAACLVVLWADYLSLAGAGQIFYDFQWDALLLETTLLAVFLAPWTWRIAWKPSEPPRIARWLLWWLLFRLMLLSGLVKLGSGDPTWWHLSALSYHFWTQPLPTPLAWYANLLPPSVLSDACAAMFAIELLAPFFLFGPRTWRHVGAIALILLQVAIALTGNYTFFNLLSIALCLLWFDDAWWAKMGQLLRIKKEASQVPAAPPPGPILRFFATVVLVTTIIEATADFHPSLYSVTPVTALVGAVAPFRSLNNYGLFARMTTTRPELIFSGSEDGRIWQEYGFPHKPGDLARRPDFVAPGQPRLDWQLWFAALESPEENRWILSVCKHLLEGTPEVLGLFGHNPFAGHPPKYVRVVRYEYRFTTAADKARTGQWWSREVSDIYIHPVSLDQFGGN